MKIKINRPDRVEEVDRSNRRKFIKNILFYSCTSGVAISTIPKLIINAAIKANELKLPETTNLPPEFYGNEVPEEEINEIEDSSLENDVEKNYNALMNHKKYTVTLKKSFSELSRYDDYIQIAADKTGLDKNLLYAVFAAESMGKKRAKSGKGAKGPAQFMKTTALEMGLVINDIIDERYHPKSLIAGAEYLDKINVYDNLALMLCAYNKGPSFTKKVVKKYGTEWKDIKWKLPKETRNYVVRVLSRKKILDNIDFEQKTLFSEVVKNSIKHELKPKETLFKLSKEYNVPVELIKEYNPKIKDFNKVDKLYVINIPKVK